MALPNWIKNNTWQWIIGTIIAIAAITVPLVLSKQGGDNILDIEPSMQLVSDLKDQIKNLEKELEEKKKEEAYDDGTDDDGGDGWDDIDLGVDTNTIIDGEEW